MKSKNIDFLTLADQTAGEAKSKDRSLEARWKHEEFFNDGYVPVPNKFLELYSYLKPFPLTTSEALFVLQIMTFKWTADAPFPSYARIAHRMGVTDKAVRRMAQSIESKGYLKRISRQGSTNKFDFNPLFDALLQAQTLSRRKAA